jgi:sulfate transport system permease protein
VHLGLLRARATVRAVARQLLPPLNPKAIRHDPAYVRWTLIAIVMAFLTVMVLVPLVNVFYQAFSRGWDVFAKALTDRDTLAALRLTLVVTGLAVCLNITFGLAAAWAIARFRFAGKALLTALIDLPFSVSPVIAGLVFVLLFGASGFFGPWLQARGIHIVFAVPGIVLATTFVTLPFVARELVPVLEAVGTEEELAARTLGAKSWQMFWYVTLPNIKWGLLYGVLLCSARALGDFGAVSVVSGKKAGQTDTLPIHVEKLYQGIGANATAMAFSVASLLACLAIVTLAIKSFLEWKTRQQLRDAGRPATVAASFQLAGRSKLETCSHDWGDQP